MEQNEQILELLENLSDTVAEQGKTLETLQNERNTTSHENFEERVLSVIENTENPQTVYDLIQNIALFGMLIYFVISPVMKSRFGSKMTRYQKLQLKIEKANHNILKKIKNHLKL